MFMLLPSLHAEMVKLSVAGTLYSAVAHGPHLDLVVRVRSTVYSACRRLTTTVWSGNMWIHHQNGVMSWNAVFCTVVVVDHLFLLLQ